LYVNNTEKRMRLQLS